MERVIIRVGGEVVSEEPGTEGQRGVFHQGGVQDLSTAVFCWQAFAGIRGDHLDLLTEANTETEKESWRHQL